MIATSKHYGVCYNVNVSRWLVLNSYTDGTMSRKAAQAEAKRRNASCKHNQGEWVEETTTPAGIAKTPHCKLCNVRMHLVTVRE